MNIENTIRAHALANAIKFKGEANPGAVLGKVVQEFPEMKKDMKSLKSKVNDIVAKVNSMSLEQQEEANKKYDGQIVTPEKKRKSIFSFLNIQDAEHVVTAFPPEPSKYPHIGHAKAILVNYLLAKEYGGKFILRFEDTNPTTVKEEFYDKHLRDYKWLGVEPDKVVYVSDYMDEFIDLADRLVAEGQAYVETGSQEEVRNARRKGLPTLSRQRSVEENQKLWAAFDKANEGEVSLRLKIDPAHKNSTMRDPIIMRIIDAEHPRIGRKYRVWPTYDFENSVMDGLNGVTHRLRSKEFEMRGELQHYIQNILKFKLTKISEFARFNLEGVLSSGRIIREKIEKGDLIGWDDPSLTTLAALRRRGFKPEAIKDFVVSTGLTKSESTLTWDDLIMHNKRLLDKECSRYFFIKDPTIVEIENAPKKTVQLKLHPEAQERGYRTFELGRKFYLSGNDVSEIGSDELVRLMGAYNVRKAGTRFEFVSESLEDYKKAGKKIIHWLPNQENLVPVRIMMPDKSISEGIAEPGINELKVGDQIQFERFGFCRLDSITNLSRLFWFTSK